MTKRELVELSPSLGAPARNMAKQVLGRGEPERGGVFARLEEKWEVGGGGAGGLEEDGGWKESRRGGTVLRSV